MSPFCQFEVRTTLLKSVYDLHCEEQFIFSFLFFFTFLLPFFHAVIFVLVQPAMEGVEVRISVEAQEGVLSYLVLL